MRKSLAAGLAGALFGLGLAIAGMTDPAKVLGFLDLAGRWDASLLFVLGGAVAVTAVLFRFVLRRPRPLLEERFHLPEATAVDGPLLAGAALFGAGWGIGGYCPGPAFALLAVPSWETWVFVPAMVAGFVLHRLARAAAVPKSGSQDSPEASRA